MIISEHNYKFIIDSTLEIKKKSPYLPLVYYTTGMATLKIIGIKSENSRNLPFHIREQTKTFIVPSKVKFRGSP